MDRPLAILREQVCSRLREIGMNLLKKLTHAILGKKQPRVTRLAPPDGGGLRIDELPAFTLKVADLMRDRDLLKMARRDAAEWIAKSPGLTEYLSGKADLNGVVHATHHFQEVLHIFHFTQNQHKQFAILPQPCLTRLLLDEFENFFKRG